MAVSMDGIWDDEAGDGEGDSNVGSASARLQVSEDGMAVSLDGMEDNSDSHGDAVSVDWTPRQTGRTQQQRWLDELWRRVVAEGVFRICWTSLQPDCDRALRADVEDDAYQGWLLFDVLRCGHSSKCWVCAYACAFAQNLWMSRAGRGSRNDIEAGGDSGGGSALNVTVLSDLKRGEAIGDRRLLEIRLAIVERLLVLQSLSSVLNGADALLAAL